jgi:hypothetical protein
MPEPTPTRIRAYTPSDEKQVRFMVGQAQMECLAFANSSSEQTFLDFPSRATLIADRDLFKAYLHPITLAVWICVSSVFAHYMDWWPNSTHGILSWLQLLPAFFAPAVPILFLVDWYSRRRFLRHIPLTGKHRINRPYVEDTCENVLRRIDLTDIQTHYGRSPASGFWMLEHADKLIGLIAIDASLDAANDEVATKESGEWLQTRLRKKGTSRVATIRHFFAEEAYRKVRIEDDMLRFAVKSTFGADRNVKSIRMLASPLRPAILDTLRGNKFSKGDRESTIGIQGWEVCWYTLERAQWEAAAKET